MIKALNFLWTRGTLAAVLLVIVPVSLPANWQPPVQEFDKERGRQFRGIDCKFMAGPINSCKGIVGHACLMLDVGSDVFSSAHVSQFLLMAAGDNFSTDEKLALSAWDHRALLAGMLGCYLEGPSKFISSDIESGRE